MDTTQLTTTYHLIAELFLHPKERDENRIKAGMAQLETTSAAVQTPLTAFFAAPLTASEDEYVSTLELTPLVPLYLGSHIFAEPDSCRGAGMSGRNGYMLELNNVYRHFGVDFAGGEMPDFVPVIIDFLGISLERRKMDTIGLRRYLLETLLQKGFETLLSALRKHESPYAYLIEALQIALDADMKQMVTGPIWQPPPKEELLKNPAVIAA